MSELLPCALNACNNERYQSAIKEAHFAERARSIVGAPVEELPPIYLTIFETVREQALTIGRCAVAVKEGRCPRYAFRSEPGYTVLTHKEAVSV